MSNPKFDNPVTGHYRGYPIKKYNVIQIRVSGNEYRHFIDAKIDHGLSARSFIERGGALCNCSGPLIIKKAAL